MNTFLRKKFLIIFLSIIMVVCFISTTAITFATTGMRADGGITIDFDSATDLDEFIVDSADGNSNGNAVVENGQLKLTKEKGWGQYALRLGYTQMSQFTASMDIVLDTDDLITDASNVDVSIGFATRLTKGTAWTSKNIDATLSAAASRAYVGAMVTRGDPSYAEYNKYESNADYAKVTFTVIGNGTSIKAYLDGVQILENVKDGVAATTLNSGDIAILLYGTAGVTLYVDNFSVVNAVVEPGTRADGDITIAFDSATDLDEFIVDSADGNSNGTAVVENGQLKLTKEKGWGQYALRLGYTSMPQFTASMDIVLDTDDLITDASNVDVNIGFATRLTKGTAWTAKSMECILNAAKGRSYVGKLIRRGDPSYDEFGSYQTESNYSKVTYTVIGDGTSIKTYVDGVQILENVKDGVAATTLNSGDIAILLYGTAGVTLYVDNITVKASVVIPEIPAPELPTREDGDISIDFDDASDLDEFHEDPADGNFNGTVVVENGQLKLTKEKGWGQYALRLGYTSMPQFTASMDIVLDTDDLITDASNVDVSIGFATRLTKGTAWTSKNIDATLSAAASRAYVGAMVTRGDPSYAEYDKAVTEADYSKVTFTVIGDGTSIKAYLDGVQILENVKDGVSATSLNSGDIAILMYGTAGATLYVDNVTVKASVVVPEIPAPELPTREDGDVSIDFDEASDFNEFHEDPADGNSNGTAVVENGQLKLTKEKGWGFYALRLGYTSMTQFTASMDITINSEDLDSDTANPDVNIGFATRLTKNNAWTAMSMESILSANPTRMYAVHLVSRGDNNKPYDLYAAMQTDLNYGVSVNLTVVGDGTSIKVYANGNLIAQNIKAGADATDTKFTTGDIALLFYGQAGATVYVDNLSVIDEAKAPTVVIPSYELKDSMEFDFDSEEDITDFVKNVRDGGAEGSLTVSNGELRLAFEKGTSDAQWAAWRLANAGEKFTLTIDVAMEKGLLGVFVRTGQDKFWGEQGVMLQDNVDQGGSFALVGYPAGTIYGGPTEDGNVLYLGDTVKQYVQVKIIGEGNKITVLIGNEYAKTFENKEDGVVDPTTPLTGEIGFLLYNTKGDAIAYLDNLKLIADADYTPPEILGAIDDGDDGSGNNNGNNQNKPTEDKKSGCGSSVSAVSFVCAISVLGCASFVIRRKKQ